MKYVALVLAFCINFILLFYKVEFTVICVNAIPSFDLLNPQVSETALNSRRDQYLHEDFFKNKICHIMLLTR